jgi:hypothetical protein
MRLQWLVTKDGRPNGVALMRGNGVIVAASCDQEKPWRICDQCRVQAACAFCMRHAEYLCNECLDRHLREKQKQDPMSCYLLSTEGVRQLAQEAKVGWP